MDHAKEEQHADPDPDHICDLCGDVTRPGEECNALACTFNQCPGGVYHQDCLYQFLKANKLEKNRKTGFKCPRGYGKGTRYTTPCPGRIDKSHPLIPKNEDRAKKRQAAAVETTHGKPPKPPDKAAEKAAKAEQKAAAARAKEEERAKSKANAAAAPVPNNKPIAARDLAKAQGVKAGKDKGKAEIDLQQAKLLKQQALREIKGEAGPSHTAAPSSIATGRSSTAASTVNGSAAWGAKGAVAAVPEPALPPPPTAGTSLGDIILAKAQVKVKQRASPVASLLDRTSSAALSSTSEGGSPPPAEPLDVLDHQQFPPVAPTPPAAHSPSPHHGKHSPIPAAAGSVSTAWPPLADSPVGLQRQASESQSGLLPTAPASTQEHHHIAADDTASVSAASGDMQAVNGGVGLMSGEVEDEDAAAKQAALTKTQRKNLKRAEKKKKHGQPEAAAAAAPQLEVKEAAAAPAATTVATSSAAAPPSGFQPSAASQPDPAATAAATVQQDEGSHQQAVVKPQQGATPSMQVTAEAPLLPEPQPELVLPDLHCAVRAHLLDHATPQELGAPQHLSPMSQPHGNGDAHMAGSSSSMDEDMHHTQLQPPPDVLSPHPQHKLDLMELMCVQELVGRKCRGLFAQLRKVGFGSFHAASAVRARGCHTEHALLWLLEHRNDTPAQLWGAANAEVLPTVDIRVELKQLRSAHESWGIPTEAILQAVIQAKGDVGGALASLQPQLCMVSSSPDVLPNQHSLESFHTAASDFNMAGPSLSLSRAATMQSAAEGGWLLEEHSLASEQLGHMPPAGYSYSSTSLPGLLQHGVAGGGLLPSASRASMDTSGYVLGHQDSFYLSHGTEEQPAQAATAQQGAWDASSTSGVYSRQGVNGSAWNSHGSVDNGAVYRAASVAGAASVAAAAAAQRTSSALSVEEADEVTMLMNLMT